jgi:predicted methyltransferase
MALLWECSQYAIMDNMVGREYYRLGGHGNAPLRYNHKTMMILERHGLVARTGGYTATEKGRKFLRNQPPE